MTTIFDVLTNSHANKLRQPAKSYIDNQLRQPHEHANNQKCLCCMLWANAEPTRALSLTLSVSHFVVRMRAPAGSFSSSHDIGPSPRKRCMQSHHAHCKDRQTAGKSSRLIGTSHHGAGPRLTSSSP